MFGKNVDNIYLWLKIQVDERKNKNGRDAQQIQRMVIVAS